MTTATRSIRKLATILAALRYYQANDCAPEDQDIHDIATDGGALAALNSEDIDDLCESLNCSSNTTSDPLAARSLELIGAALKAFPHVEINDVDAKTPGEVILTLDAGKDCHVIRITEHGIANLGVDELKDDLPVD